jgi:hypothetical protein
VSLGHCYTSGSIIMKFLKVPKLYVLWAGMIHKSFLLCRNFLDHSEYGHGMSDIIIQNVLVDRYVFM